MPLTLFYIGFAVIALLALVFYILSNQEEEENMASGEFGSEKMPETETNEQNPETNLNTRLERARETAIKSEIGSVIKSRFIAYMTHEIRSSLNIVMGMSQLILEEKNKLSEKQLEYIYAIMSASEKLLTVTKNIAEFSTIEKSDRRFNYLNKSFSLKTLCEEIVNEATPVAQNKQLKIELDIEVDVPEYIIGEKSKVSQMLSTLIDNAIRFTNEGYIAIKILNDKSSDPKTTRIIFKITDTGPGISSEKLNEIFDFTIDDVATARRQGNVRLGLAVCKFLAESMGGTIQAHSEKDKGTTFEISIPFRVGTAEPTQKSEDAKVIIKSPENLSGKKALLVEDEPINRQIEKIFLEKAGFVVDIAENGKHGLEKFKANKYDIVFMDCEMPLMNGYSAARAIREFEAGKSHTPIIAMTAFALPGDRELCIEAGMDDYISKPVNLKILIETASRNLPCNG